MMQAARLNREGTRKTWSMNHPTIVTKAVCIKCNSGWMSDLEKAAESVIAPLIDGRPTELTLEHQVTIAAWVLKCAMVFDSMDGDESFYDESDRFHFRATLAPSAYTRFWIGRYSGEFLRLFTRHGTKSSPQSATPFTANILTMAFGRLVIQMLDIKLPQDLDGPSFEIKTNRQWSTRTIDIVSHPYSAIQWPPSISFDDFGHTFDEFSDRFGRLI
jgi:hypothetical protein